MAALLLIFFSVELEAWAVSEVILSEAVTEVVAVSFVVWAALLTEVTDTSVLTAITEFRADCDTAEEETAPEELLEDDPSLVAYWAALVALVTILVCSETELVASLEVLP